MKICLILASCSVVLLAGCGAMQNLSTEDIIQPQYLRRSEVIEKTIPEIQQAIFDYSAKCTQLPPLRVNPSNPKTALYLTTMMGLTQANPGIVITFNQSGERTQAASYSYNYGFAWPSRIDDIFEAINNPTKCR